ncbi:hypothetical protein [Anaeromicropila populeti]|uniref:Uncharacterized protein n=1 Tax=Anaeromicropila populeti TaxID=37658 RepID=A0A1I6JCX1_9FIRM|nr:hypothetical protein [Anaeromicropila populeti]SFR76816.1 hypothetical protein SAMN05661086_01575 [Anaeromicropila populeti]
MIIGEVQGSNAANVKKGIEIFSHKLGSYLETYMKIMDFQGKEISEESNYNAKVLLNYLAFPNQPAVLNEYSKIQDNVDEDSQKIFSNNIRIIMQLIGQIAECMIMDKCSKDPAANMICMNTALKKKNIFERDESINYDEYVSFSPSYRYILKEDEDGTFKKRLVSDYSPKQARKDISWCSKENFVSQFKQLGENNIQEYIKLNVIAAMSHQHVMLTEADKKVPIIYFGLSDDYYQLIAKYPDHFIVPIERVGKELVAKCHEYFRLLCAFLSGIEKKIEIKDIHVLENMQLIEAFQVKEDDLAVAVKNKKVFDFIIKEIKEYDTPIEMGV